MVIHDLKPVLPGSGFFICSRLKNREGNWATRDDFSEVTVRVVEEETGTLVSSSAPAVADIVFDSLQLDGRWSKDRLGYNFCLPTAATDTPDADTTYLFKVKLTGDGSPMLEYFRVRTLAPTFI